jgi:LysM repeat protein
MKKTTAIILLLVVSAILLVLQARLRTANSALAVENGKLTTQLKVVSQEAKAFADALNAHKAAEQKQKETAAYPVITFHQVVPCDTLWDLAEQYYGDPLYFPTIAKANDISGPKYTIYVDEDLIIPEIPKERVTGLLLEVKSKEIGCGESLPQVVQPEPNPEPSKSQAQIQPNIGQRMPETAKEPIEYKISVPKTETTASAPRATPKPEARPTIVLPKTAAEEQPAASPAAEPKPLLQQPVPTAIQPPIDELDYPATLPGSFWVVAGNLSPIEMNNQMLSEHLEQGLTLWRDGKNSIVPYVSVDATSDSKGYDWNNKLTLAAGMKYIRGLPHGVVQVGAAYASEQRFKSANDNSQLMGFSSYWFGWQPLTSVSDCEHCPIFPGSSWGIVGNVSPAEHNNVIGLLYAQQGVRIGKLKRVSIVPYFETTLGWDSQDKPWNNRRVLGGGIKGAIPVGSSIINIGGVWRDEYRWLNKQRASGWTVYVDLWSGWNPSVKAPKGGR